jgi:hypothetical protein
MRNQGIVAGILGCLFAVLGIFTIGIIFVPIAALCSLIGLIRGISGPSLAGIATSLLGAVLTIFGFISSPTLWLFAAGLFVASQSNNSATSQPEMPVVEKTTSEPQSPSLPNFDIASNANSLPRSGPKAWCRQSEVVRNIMKGLNSTTAVQRSGEQVIDFENATTIRVDAESKTFSCHGVAHLSNGQFLPGTFSAKNNAAGNSIWNWMND